MANVTSDENIVVDRDYSDVYAIKETAMNTLGKKYFEDVSLSALNVGELGFVLEQIGTITEDAFNTASVLINEAFPNKCVIPESIYSHAAIFQLDNTFTPCAQCVFILMLEQNEILKYGKTDNNRTVFYLDKNTIINVEGIPFTLDYDIRIDALKHQVTGSLVDYNFSAKYVVDTENSISEINDPYIKIRKTPNGYIILQVTAHQVERHEDTDIIINNTKVNYPVLNFEFEGGLAGFDIFYKSPTDTEYTQLEKRLKFTLPVKRPFCYYKLKDEQTLEISFSSRDSYFQPDFNSEIKIVMYTTLGESGNFESYSGTNIDLQMDSNTYDYNHALTLAVKPIADSSGGGKKLTEEELKAITVENYSSATEISTDYDVQQYFYNYKYRYGNEIMVIKRRDDITERLLSAFLLLKNGNYIYPTNTSNLNILDTEFDSVDDLENHYTLKSGHVFVYSNNSNTLRMIPDIMAYDKDAVEELMEEYDFVYTLPFLISVTKNPNMVGLYQNIINQTVILNYISSNNDSFEQFITSKLNLNRGLSEELAYNLSLSIIPSSSVDQYVTNLNTYEGNTVRVIAAFIGSDGEEIGYIEMLPTEISESDSSNVTFTAKLETDDVITTNGMLAILNAVRVDKKDDKLWISMTNTNINIYILYNDALTEENQFSEYFDGMRHFVVTNVYGTNGNSLTFIKPLNMMRSTVLFSNAGTQENPIVNANIQLLPVIKANIVNDTDNFNVFINRLTSNYNYLESSLPKLRECTNLDIKFYNSYGRSNNYYIGDNEELIDMVNIKIKFIVTLVEGSDEIEVKKQLVSFIKEFIEQLNSDGTNSLFISNLISAIENNFPSVHHLKFIGINDYDTSYQTISVRKTDLSTLTKEERRKYVPEILVIDSENIILSINTVE